MADIQAVLAALDVFTSTTDKAAIERANSWLQDFQHSPDAWSTCNVLLLSPEAPLPAKIFAAQTFRAKVTYDLSQVSPGNLPPLRDTLISALQTYHNGPRTIIVQLSLAIAGLALQMPSWENPTQALIDTFGRNPTTVPTLLEFLTLLPEEVGGNTRIPVTDEEYHNRFPLLITNNAQKVLELLNIYINASGVTSAVQSQVFNCLYTWLVAGEITTQALAETPLFAFTFEALNSEELFDAAVDVVCQMVHETQEIEDNMSVIELIVPRIINLRPKLTSHRDDPEVIRGLARIFSETGETYRSLLVQHTETFFPIVEAIGECSAYPDLDIVPITFPFWMRLAQMLGKRSSTNPLFVSAFETLMTVIIRHLHFPADSNILVGQEAEAFRSFRHVMGDTLKDCCFVLRTDTCLMAAYQLIATGLARGQEATWQEIEAPLFAMRSMGAEMDPNDANVVPKIMDLIPSLPNHPRVRYAALMLVSRYTEWINNHPEYIRFQLEYIASGFDDADQEVCAAAGQALKYLCQDCKEHLTEFLPMLHAFLTAKGAKLVQDDRRQVYEAIAYVISAMPMERAAESLKTFATDILAGVHAFSAKATLTKQEIETVGDSLENLEVMLHVIQGYGEELPETCQGTCKAAWDVFDAFLLKHGANYDLAERVTRVLRRGIDLFNKSALLVSPSVLARMSFGFEAVGYPSFLWIAGKIISRFGYETSQDLAGAIKELYERSTHKVASLLQHKSPSEIPDVLEDYIQMLNQLANLRPDIFYTSSAFPIAFQSTMAGLMVVHGDIIFLALDLFRAILTHDCLMPSPTPPPAFPGYAKAIRAVMAERGMPLLGYMLTGFTGDFPGDTASTVISIFRTLAHVWPTELLAWLPAVLEELPTSTVPVQAKTTFLSDVTNAINSGQLDKVKPAILAFDRASRKARDRRRTGFSG